MIFQSAAVTEILLGRDAGWRAQRRGDRGVARQEIYRKLAVPTLCGIAMAASAYAISVPLLLWMSPVIVGLVGHSNRNCHVDADEVGMAVCDARRQYSTHSPGPGE